MAKDKMDTETKIMTIVLIVLIIIHAPSMIEKNLKETTTICPEVSVEEMILDAIYSNLTVLRMEKGDELNLKMNPVDSIDEECEIIERWIWEDQDEK